MSCNWLIGGTSHLDFAKEYLDRYWPDLEICKISIDQNSQYDFNFNTLNNAIKKGDSAFIAFDGRFGNFKRLELMHFVANKGGKLINIVSPNAMVAANVKLGNNVFIGDGCIIGSNSRIDYNSVILPGSIIGSNTFIRSSNWIESGVHIGNNVTVDSNSKICTGAIISDNVKIGKNCELGWPQRYDFNISAGTFYDPKFDNAILTKY